MGSPTAYVTQQQGRDGGILAKIGMTAGLLGSENGPDLVHLTLAKVASLADEASGSDDGSSCGNAETTTRFLRE